MFASGQSVAVDRLNPQPKADLQGTQLLADCFLFSRLSIHTMGYCKD